MGLKQYKAKRNFSRTAEPKGKVAPRHKGHLTFVVQKHAATRLHYDFRLEMEGVLKSWAVPKGFPTKRGDRRLAVEVEDHPFDYGGFEGTIAPGNYGAGTVMLWDRGTYEVSGDDPLQALKAGKLHLVLHGKKLNGEWTLVRMRPLGNSDKPQWLLLKSGEDVPPISAKIEDQSVLSGRSMAEIAHANDNEWKSNRSAKASSSVRALAGTTAEAPRSKRTRIRASDHEDSRPSGSAVRLGKQKTARGSVSAKSRAINLSGLPRATASFREPMKALLVEKLPVGDNWVYEVKFDGIRALGIKQGSKVQLLSRTEKELTFKYRQIAEALKQANIRDVVLDGEIVALDPQGRSSFQLLQAYEMAGGSKPPLLYYVFDLLNLDGRDVSGLQLEQRKSLAESVIGDLKSPLIRFSPTLKGASEKVMHEMQARGLEGLIAKKRDSKYEPGRRSGAWAKFKWTLEQEFVIGGFTPPQGTRCCFGAILVGYYEGPKLIFAGKVGTGFTQKILESLYAKFKKLVRPDCPFANLPEKLAGSGGKGMTAGEMRRCTWLEPKLVAQIRFAEWTRDSHLRQPSFLGLREDRRPEEVVRERPTTA